MVEDQIITSYTKDKLLGFHFSAYDLVYDNKSV
jgi:hypothetical protein